MEHDYYDQRHVQTSTQTVSPAQPVKYSRYRAVRNAAAATAPSTSTSTASTTHTASDTQIHLTGSGSGRRNLDSGTLAAKSRNGNGYREEEGSEEDYIVVPKVRNKAGRPFVSEEEKETEYNPGHKASASTSSDRYFSAQEDFPQVQSSHRIAAAAPNVGSQAAPPAAPGTPEPSFENIAQKEAYAILTGDTDRQKKLRQAQCTDDRAKQKAALEREQERKQAELDVARQIRKKQAEEESARQLQSQLQLQSQSQSQAREREQQMVRQRTNSQEKQTSGFPMQAQGQPHLRQRSVEHAGHARKISTPSRPLAAAPDRVFSSPERLASSADRNASIGSMSYGSPVNTRIRARTDETQRITPAVGYDAPISAVNAGRRRKVRVICNDHATDIPVTNESTAADVLRSAAAVLSLSPPSSGVGYKYRYILAESITHLGLERPLRTYERIRDVLNSWDRDDQHALLVLPNPTFTTPAGAENGVLESGGALEADDAPLVQPGETAVHMYYSSASVSQKPGAASWDKRWINLRSDGQVTISKEKKSSNTNNGAKEKVKETNICHMTDFDVYTLSPPPQANTKPLVRPPKPFCIAIKSQQKAAMFLNSKEDENNNHSKGGARKFVHYFATKDEALARAWYAAAQGWRSWYLVHAMGLGKEHAGDGEEVMGTGMMGPAKSQTPYSHLNHQRSASTSSTPAHAYRDLYPTRSAPQHYQQQQQQSQQPLISEITLRSASTGGPAFLPSNQPLYSQLNARGGPPPPAPSFSYPRKLTKAATTPTVTPPSTSTFSSSAGMNGGIMHSSSSSTSTPAGRSSIVQGPPPIAVVEPFAASGLLGRAYTLRQRAAGMQENNGNGAAQEIGGFNTINNNNNIHNAPPMPPLTAPLPDLQQQHRPLVYTTPLTPWQQQEQQLSPKGRGIAIAVDNIPSGGLVNLATTSREHHRNFSSGGVIHNNINTINNNINNINTTPTAQYAATLDTNSPADETSTGSGGAFTGGSLLARMDTHHSNHHPHHNNAYHHRQRKGTIGSGSGDGQTLADGGRDGPLVDLTRPSAYVVGSLLHGVERYQEGQYGQGQGQGGGGFVVADREKRREVVERVGEGL